MSQNTFFIADTHFGHQGVCEFLREDGSKLRHWESAAEMDEELVKNWNSVVRPCDKVYHLGDVAIKHQALKILERLNGDKVLIKGNHDIHKLRYYTPYFRDIRAYHIMDKMICSHIPVHPDSKGRFRANIHGHTHARRIMKEDRCLIGHWDEEVQDYKLFPVKKIDPFYFCVSVEQINYTPISYEEILKQL